MKEQGVGEKVRERVKAKGNRVIRVRILSVPLLFRVLP